MTALLRLFAPFCLLLSSLAFASPLRWPLSHGGRSVSSGSSVYTDQVSRMRVTVPSGWRVRAETLNGVRQLRVIPPKADQRERAAIEVVLRVRPLRRGETLARTAKLMRRSQGDREAAESLRLSPRGNRLVVEYRESRNVSDQLWIVRRNLNVWQRVDKKHVLEALCAANESEYKTYRKNLETICYSTTYSE